MVAHHCQHDLFAGVQRDGQGEAVISFGPQQRARGPGGGAQQGFGARQGLQEHAIGQVRERSRA